jgi:hypothetical protein
VILANLYVTVGYRFNAADTDVPNHNYCVANRTNKKKTFAIHNEDPNPPRCRLGLWRIGLQSCCESDTLRSSFRFHYNHKSMSFRVSAKVLIESTGT